MKPDLQSVRIPGGIRRAIIGTGAALYKLLARLTLPLAWNLSGRIFRRQLYPLFIILTLLKP